uniref:Uncharacterized protein n=1 Tax=Amphimedon queenslandica TaxID=400682 RepID=A0A1X7UQC6_AMPQE
ILFLKILILTSMDGFIILLCERIYTQNVFARQDRFIIRRLLLGPKMSRID